MKEFVTYDKTVELEYGVTLVDISITDIGKDTMRKR